MSRSTKKEKPWNYEEAVAEVEALIGEIESGSLSLEVVFEKFGRAIERLRQCETFLERGKGRMNLLIEELNGDLEF
jgi:exodeoxyribonuclease VII small subunit